MNFYLEPYLRCGEIAGGMTYRAAEEFFKGRTQPFTRNQFSRHPSLIVGSTELILSFSEAGQCDGVEIFPEAGIRLLFKAVNVFPAANLEFAGIAAALGEPIEIDSYGLRCKGLGVSTYNGDFEASSFKAGQDFPIDSIDVSLIPGYLP